MKNQKQLRCGITTGTCAAAAAKAAASLLLLKIRKEEIAVRTPKGVTVLVPVKLSEDTEKKAEYSVVKDSGDDPDVTNHSEIYVSVERLDEDALTGQKVSVSGLMEENGKAHSLQTAFTDERYPGLFLDGGEGVGRVTKEGLEQAVGQAAINTVPRFMIFQAVDEVRTLAEEESPLLITVRVPAGAELAVRTFNPRLGITGGISILGTSGILEPMSEKAIVDTIETEIRQLHANGVENILVTPGNYGQSYAQEYLHLDMEKSIKCSNYIGDAIDLAVSYEMKNFLLVGNIGKLVKLAGGIMNTHSKVADGRGEIMAAHTALCGGSGKMVREIMNCINTEEMLSLLDGWEMKEAVMKSLLVKIEEHVGHRILGRMGFGVILFSERYGCLGETKAAKELLALYR